MGNEDTLIIMKSKKTLILTGTTDILRSPTETDNSYKELLQLTLPSMQRYAEKYDYDLLVMRSFGEDSHNRFLNTHIGSNMGFLRVLRAFEMLDYYDNVMWIDGDSIVTNNTYAIDDFHLDENHCFYASWDWNGKYTFSTGNFIIQKNKHTKEFFDQFILTSQYIISNNIWGQEQTTLNAMYTNSSLRNVIKILDHKYLGAIPGIEMYPGISWSKDRMSPRFPWNEDAFICHITGLVNATRVHILKTHFNKYL